jgi:NAD(P)-dependent dehydrogenase (short-subunit alcohol dehydrogenase family)
MDLNLHGRKALITGGSRGIGLAIARALVQEGCAIRLASRDAESLDRASQTLVAIGGEVSTHVFDLTRTDDQSRLGEVADDVDILVNNAGAIPRGDLIAIDDSRWRDAWDLKVFGYINLTRAIYRRMKGRRSGVIINVIGVGGERPTSAYIAGSAGNAALMAFTCALGGESVDHGVRVLGVNPGLVETDRMRDLLLRDAEVQLGDASRWRELTASRPFGRAARPEEIADVVAFMASSRASYMSGTIVTVDGGSTTRQPPL